MIKVLVQPGARRPALFELEKFILFEIIGAWFY